MNIKQCEVTHFRLQNGTLAEHSRCMFGTNTACIWFLLTATIMSATRVSNDMLCHVKQASFKLRLNHYNTCLLDINVTDPLSTVMLLRIPQSTSDRCLWYCFIIIMLLNYAATLHCYTVNV